MLSCDASVYDDSHESGIPQHTPRSDNLFYMHENRTLSQIQSPHRHTHLHMQLLNTSEEAQNLVEFTDEEGYGRYLDLHDCYLKYINLKASEKLDYITYLSIFDQLFDIPKERKNAEYKRYLEMLLEYLQDYTDRVKPLQDQNELFGKIQNDFEKKWENGTFPGWPKETSNALTHAGAHLDLSAFSSWEELASLGLDRLKSALLALGLKCGGTIEERAQRLFSTKGKSVEALDTSLFAKKPQVKGHQTPCSPKTPSQRAPNEILRGTKTLLSLKPRSTNMWRFLGNSDISLMKMSNANRQGQEKSKKKKKRKSRSVSVKVKMKRTRSFTTPKTCPWAGTANPFPTGCTNSTA
ncbi:Splicing factor 3A subunit 3 [Myotis brandtii]|uniref:Splicing factor 3A subunit 3 n=1 Tax=Myotis brandtii TaxID=109478 RepID=S7NDX9_MYOBR|nr:Splicing factor 3A subunit 3 [Myotis brandtii]